MTDPRVQQLQQQSTAQKWRYALKLASWPKVLVPYLLGSALGIRQGVLYGTLQHNWWLLCLLVGAAMCCLLAFIVLLNDWADQKVDTLKRTKFPEGCSPKTLPDGLLPRKQVGVAGFAAGAAAALLIIMAIWLATPSTGLYVFLAAGFFCFVGYSLPPFKLNYRGGGELLEMFGTGFVLPAAMASLLTGMGLQLGLLVLLLPFVLLCLASALASGLADEQTDIAGGKRTFTTTFGNLRTRKVINFLAIAGAAGWLPAAYLCGHVLWPALYFLPAGIGLYYALKQQQASEAAVTNALKAQGHYKHYLHLCIWRSALAVAAAQLLEVALHY